MEAGETLRAASSSWIFNCCCTSCCSCCCTFSCQSPRARALSCADRSCNRQRLHNPISSTNLALTVPQGTDTLLQWQLLQHATSSSSSQLNNLALTVPQGTDALLQRPLLQHATSSSSSQLKKSCPGSLLRSQGKTGWQRNHHKRDASQSMWCAEGKLRHSLQVQKLRTSQHQIA